MNQMWNRWFLCAAVVFVNFVSAEVYHYPEAVGDVEDLAFYQPVNEYKPLKNISGTPEKVILCIGDGMGLNEVAHARQKAVGLRGRLWMETLPVFGIVRTISADHAVTDSAAAVTAIACSVKANNKTIGIGPDGKVYATVMEVLSAKGWRRDWL